MVAEFPYRPERGLRGGLIARPVAEVLLRGPSGREVYEYLYVDSGADHTLIPFRLGRYLGLVTSEADIHEIHGINGTVGVVYVRLEMEIAGVLFPAEVAWAQLEDVPPLLGRTDVFDRFEITFHPARKAVVFQPVAR